MISAYTLAQASKTVEEASRIAKVEMPQATFVFVGIDAEYVYFNLIAKHITQQQSRDIVQKTRFIPISQACNGIYKGEFQISIQEA